MKSWSKRIPAAVAKLRAHFIVKNAFWQIASIRELKMGLLPAVLIVKQTSQT